MLRRHEFKFDPEQVTGIIESIRNEGLDAACVKASETFPDPDDRVFYEVTMKARESEDAHLITGNIKHFPTKPFIVTPRQMLDLILESSNE